MQKRTVARCAFLLTLVLSVGMATLWQGCSEEKAAYTDEQAPQVSIAQLITLNPENIEVPDTTTVAEVNFNFRTYDINEWAEVTIHAQDNQAVVAVEIWCSFHNDTIPTHITTLENSAGNGLYRYMWDVQAFDNGSEGILWVTAIDASGNRGRSTRDVPIRVVTGEKRPPRVRFSISPYPSGLVTRPFSFDPTSTTDDLDAAYQIKLRWDFNGDGIWDVDTADGYTAADIVTHNYAVPGIYDVICQGWNTYFLNSGRDTVTLVVTPEGGDPNPLNPEDFVEVPAGAYPIGVQKIAGGAGSGYDLSELVDSLLYVRVSNDFRIEAYEVTNALYVRFLDEMRALGTIEYDPFSTDQRVTLISSGKVLINLDENLTYIRFLDEETGFTVDELYRYHPVTGVSWFGADEYARYYGLRLPSEMEWEIAARAQAIHTTEGTAFLYPWTPNNTIDPMYANYKNSGDPYESGGNLRASTPVGAYNGSYMGTFPTLDAVGPFGTYDQAGNVSEWVKDWYHPDTWHTLLDDFLDSGSYPIDPQGPLSGTYRVVRGGSFFDKESELRVTKRQGSAPDQHSTKIGFRTVYTVFE
jgi:formylglycine-generating enzyme required for sulfatase activity